MTWQDTTSYSRGERGTIEPKEWTLETETLRITIHRHMHHAKDAWVLTVVIKSSRGRLIDVEPLAGKTRNSAQTEAITATRSKLKELTGDLKGVG